MNVLQERALIRCPRICVSISFWDDLFLCHWGFVMMEKMLILVNLDKKENMILHISGADFMWISNESRKSDFAEWTPRRQNVATIWTCGKNERTEMVNATNSLAINWKNVDEGMRKGIYEGIRKFNCKINYRAVMLTESEGPLVQCLEKVIFTRGK